LLFQVWNAATAGEYGADSMKEDFIQFADKGTRAGKGDKILFAQVAVTPTKNNEIARKLGMASDFKYPQIFLFQPGSSEAIPYPTKNPFNDVALTTFVSKHSDFFLGISGLEPRYDDFAKKFRDAHSIEHEGIIAEAEAALAGLTGKHLVRPAQIRV
jgi:hypothetical protein